MEASNNAKLRDLAEAVAHMNDDGYWNSSASICALVDKAKNALAEPVRNCDVGTVDEQFARFRKFCKKGLMDNFEATAYCAYECPCGNNYDCKLAWAQMPYEEGGANV